MPSEPTMRSSPPEHDLFLSILERYERPLIRYAFGYVHDMDQARDIAQEVFIKLTRHIKTLDQSRLAPWLFTVCKNRALDYQRKHQRLVPMDTIALDDHTSPAPRPSDALEAQELNQQLRLWMSELPDKQREAVKMKFETGLSYKEISEVLDTSTGNVGTLIHLGVTQLRERWLAMNA